MDDCGHSPPEEKADVVKSPSALLEYDGTNPLISECNQLAAYILAFYGLGHHSVAKLSKMRISIPLKDQDGTKRLVTPRFNWIAKHIQEKRSFDPAAFDLPPIIQWLDASIALGSGGAGFKIQAQNPDGLGTLKPTVNGYGSVWGSFQSVTLQNIVTLHAKLVASAENAVGQNAQWLNDLRMLANDCVSSVEITLHHAYNIGRFNAAAYGLVFDQNDLGSPVGRPLKEKLNWVFKLTKKDINAGPAVMEGFHRLRALRNHLNHFDPPCFAFDISDVALWLNSVSDVGRLLWCIRRCFNHSINKQIVEVITLPRVKPTTKARQSLRTAYSNESGYGTCRWIDREE